MGPFSSSTVCCKGLHMLDEKRRIRGTKLVMRINFMVETISRMTRIMVSLNIREQQVDTRVTIKQDGLVTILVRASASTTDYD
jgi:hypothetical protein